MVLYIALNQLFKLEGQRNLLIAIHFNLGLSISSHGRAEIKIVKPWLKSIAPFALNRLFWLIPNFLIIRVKCFRLFLEELVVWVEQSPKPHLARCWKEILHLLPSPLCEAFKPRSWRHLYSTTQLNASLARVRVVGYDEKLVRIYFLKNITIHQSNLEIVAFFSCRIFTELYQLHLSVLDIALVQRTGLSAPTMKR